MSLVRLEVEERAGGGLDRLTACRDPHRPVDDDEPGVLLHLVLAELLAGLERDQHRATLRDRVEDEGRARAARKLEPAQLPALHGDRSTHPSLFCNVAGKARPEQKGGQSRLAIQMPLAIDRYELG